jgi:hypothetical protein
VRGSSTLDVQVVGLGVRGSPPTARDAASVVRRLIAAAAAIVLALVATAPSASAACRPAPSASAFEGVYDTSGLRFPGTASLWPGNLLGIFDSYTPEGWRVGAANPDEQLAVERCRDGRGRLTLTRGSGRALHGFPLLAAGERLGGMGWTGRYVAWRTWRPGRAGRLLVARLGPRGVVGRVRSVAVRGLPRQAAYDPRVAVSNDGVALWTLPQGPTDRTWVSAPGRRTRVLVRSAPRKGDLTLFDDAHVLMGDATSSTARLVAFASGRPGACSGRGDDGAVRSRPVSALGGWCIRTTNGAPVDPGGGDEVNEQTIHWLYRPDDRRVLAAFVESDLADRYSTSYDCVCRIVRSGAIVIGLTTTSGSSEGDDGPGRYARTAVVDTDSGRTFYAAGTIGGPAPTAERVSAVVVDGATPWLEGHTGAPSTVWLHDAAGTRTVGETPAGGSGLAVDGATVRWTPASDQAAGSVVPQPERDVFRATWSPSPKRR